MSVTLNTSSIVSAGGDTGGDPASNTLSSFTAGEIGVLVSFCVEYSDAPATITGCTAWILSYGSDSGLSIWTCKCTTTATGKTVYGVTPSGTNPTGFIFAAYDGCNTTSWVDSGKAASFSGTASPTESWSAVNSGCLLVGGIQFGAVAGATISAGSGFSDLTTQPLATTFLIGFESGTSSLSGTSASVSFGLSSSRSGNLVGIALIPASETTDITIPDTGHGTDAVSVKATVPKISDTGHGTDSITVGIGSDVADTGHGVDVVSIRATIPAIADTGTGTDSVSIRATIPAIADAGTGADTVAVTSYITIADLGYGIDTVSVTGYEEPYIIDSGMGTDSVTVKRLNTGRVTGRWLGKLRR